MIRGHKLFNRKLLEQRTLRHLPWSHHRRALPLSKQVNQDTSNQSTDFFNMA